MNCSGDTFCIYSYLSHTVRTTTNNPSEQQENRKYHNGEAPSVDNNRCGCFLIPSAQSVLPHPCFPRADVELRV